MTKVDQNGGRPTLSNFHWKVSACPYCGKPVCPFEAHMAQHIDHCDKSVPTFALQLCTCGKYPRLGFTNLGGGGGGTDKPGVWGGDGVGKDQSASDPRVL